MTKTVKNLSFSKGTCLNTKKQKTPAASLKRRKHELGLPIHIKKVPILLNIRYYIILPIYSLYISIISNFLLEYMKKDKKDKKSGVFSH